MPADVLTDSLTVKHGEDDYTFRIPGPLEFGRVSLRARTLRLRDEPTAGSEAGLDGFTRDMYRGAALFECLLKQASVKWPFTMAGASVVVDSSKFPNDKALVLADVYEGFDNQYATFLRRGAGYDKSSGEEAVAGSPDPGEVTV